MNYKVTYSIINCMESLAANIKLHKLEIIYRNMNTSLLIQFKNRLTKELIYCESFEESNSYYANINSVTNLIKQYKTDIAYFSDLIVSDKERLSRLKQLYHINIEPITHNINPNILSIITNYDSIDVQEVYKCRDEIIQFENEIRRSKQTEKYLNLELSKLMNKRYTSLVDLLLNLFGGKDRESMEKLKRSINCNKIQLIRYHIFRYKAYINKLHHELQIFNIHDKSVNGDDMGEDVYKC